MKKLSYILIFALSIVFFSCDKIETPYKDGVETNENTSNKTRRILVEDYTGHTCGNCPSAALIAQGLHDTYGDQVIIMGVHAGWFAKPKSGPEYTTDFRNEDSEAFDAAFGNSIAGNPNGLISRTKLNGSLIIQPANWETAILGLKDLEADLGMEISSSYNATTNKISADVKTTFFNTLTGDYNIVVAFVEDSIIDWQKDYSLPSAEQDIEEYLHRHVFRGNINGTWGDAINAASTVENAEETFTYSYTPDVSWKIDNSYLIAYVYNKETYEILQVVETHIDEQ